jgi:hypothetical protein
MKKKLITNYFYDIDTFTEHYFNNKKISNKNFRKLYSSILKSQKIILIFIFCHIIIFKILTLFFKNKKYKLFILNVFYKINLFRFNKILQLFFALKQLIQGNNERIFKNNNKSYEYLDEDYHENIIIGSGPSGSITGYKLSKAGFDTLIIEKGNYYSLPKYKHPFSEFQKKWKYVGISGAIGKYDFQYASGECVGGGSEINSGLYHKLDENFLKNIKINNKNELLTIKKFEWEHLLSKEENKINTQEEVNLKDYFLSGANKQNLEIENLDIFFKNDKKNSMSETILEDAKKTGCKLLTNTEVIKFEKNNNWKISLNTNGKKRIINSKRLFLCCGAPYSLNLMKKSKCIDKNFNQDFHFHPMLKIIAKFPKKVNSINNINVINSQISHFYPDYLFGNAASNLEFLKIFAFGNKEVISDIENNFEYMSMFHVTYSLGKSDFVKIPYIDDNLIKYNFSNNDLRIVKDGLQNLINFIFNCGAEYIYIQDKEVSKITKSRNYNDIINNYKFNFSSVHLLGGLKFGESENAVLNSYGKHKSKKFDNLYVNDSSLLTEKLLKNPQGALMSISSQNIDEIIKHINA